MVAEEGQADASARAARLPAAAVFTGGVGRRGAAAHASLISRGVGPRALCARALVRGGLGGGECLLAGGGECGGTVAEVEFVGMGGWADDEEEVIDLEGVASA